jgi:hypothetical protein
MGFLRNGTHDFWKFSTIVAAFAMLSLALVMFPMWITTMLVARAIKAAGTVYVVYFVEDAIMLWVI